MEAKRRRATQDQAAPLDFAWRWLLHTARVVHGNKRYPRDLHAFAPRIFNDRLTKYHIPEDDEVDDYKLRGSYTLSNMLYRSDFMARQHNPKTLSAPFPSSPQVPPIIGFHFYRDKTPVAFHNFAALYSAQKFIELVIKDHKVEWLSDNSIQAGDITIVGEGKEDLERAMEYECSALENEFVLPSPYPQYAMAILHRVSIDVEGSQARPERIAGKTPRKQRPERASEPARREKVDIPDAVTIADIADELKMSSKEARVILRRLKVTKPAHGRWEWPKTEAAQIKATLKENQ